MPQFCITEFSFPQIVPGRGYEAERNGGKREKGSQSPRDRPELMRTVQQLKKWPLKDIWPKSLEPVDSKTKVLGTHM